MRLALQSKLMTFVVAFLEDDDDGEAIEYVALGGSDFDPAPTDDIEPEPDDRFGFQPKRRR